MSGLAIVPVLLLIFAVFKEYTEGLDTLLLSTPVYAYKVDNSHLFRKLDRCLKAPSSSVKWRQVYISTFIIVVGVHTILGINPTTESCIWIGLLCYMVIQGMWLYYLQRVDSVAMNNGFQALCALRSTF